MKIFDLSPDIHEGMVVYKDKAEKKPRQIVTRTIKDGTNESKLVLDLHTGSHVDAPFHVFKNGKTIENIDLGNFFGEAIVLDLTKTSDSIKKNDLLKFKKQIKKNDIVLLKTTKKILNKFDYNFTYLEKSGAEFLASLKVKAVGIDSLGVERNSPNHETHNVLLSKNILIFEGINLSKVPSGRYTFYGFPLKIRKGDASPIRAVLAEIS